MKGVGDLKPELGLQQRQALAGGDPQLPLHQVQPRHSLSDWVLDLQATTQPGSIESTALWTRG